MKFVIYIIINLLILYLSKEIILILAPTSQDSIKPSIDPFPQKAHRRSHQLPLGPDLNRLITGIFILILAGFQSYFDLSLNNSTPPPNSVLLLNYIIKFTFYLYLSKRSPLWCLSTLFIDLFITSGLFALGSHINAWPDSLVVCFSALLGVSIVTLILKRLKGNPFMESIRNIYNLLVVTFVCNMILYGFIIISKQLYNKANYFLYVAFSHYWVTFTMLTLFFIIAASLLESLNTYRQMQAQNELLMDYTHSLDHFESDIALYQSELQGHLQKIIQELDHQEASSIEFPPFEDAFKNSHHTLCYAKELQKIQNTGLKGLMITKLYTASQHHINFDIEIESYKGKRFINPVDLDRIIGIIMDNAIEACLECSNPYMSIQMYQEPHHYTIKITNTFSRINPNLESTKGKHRGVGRQSLDQLIKQYPRLSHAESITGTIFTQKIFIADAP